MRRVLFTSILAIALAVTPAFARGGGGHSYGGGGAGTYVHGYTRHDGTHVGGYWRSAPGDSQEYWTGRGPPSSGPESQEYWTGSRRSTGSGSSSSGGSTHRSSRHTTDWWNQPEGTTTYSAIPRSRPSERAQGVARDRHGRIQRSANAKDDFKREHPCPSTGSTSGGCPGYVIDHVIPLKRGGPDASVNMEWQTVNDAKAKDKWE